jgi:HPt (histidine-containing phosphotransfer) domain-containing protein
MTAADEPPPLDPSVIDRLRQLNQPGQPDVLQEVLALFLADGKTRLDAIAAATEAGDGDGLRRAAHTLKGAAGTIGALTLQASCRALEELGRSGALERAGGQAAAVRREYERVERAIHHLL